MSTQDFMGEKDRIMFDDKPPKLSVSVLYALTMKLVLFPTDQTYLLVHEVYQIPVEAMHIPELFVCPELAPASLKTVLSELERLELYPVKANNIVRREKLFL
jgi:hypothetical protein